MKADFRALKQELRQRIVQGIWPPGTLLPNEVDLAAEFSCARATVNRAMRELAEEGLVERKRKAGTRVRQAPLRQARFSIPLVRQEIEAQGAAYRYALVRREEQDAPDWLRARLGLGLGARVLHLICMHYADGNPYQLEDRWINLEALPDAAGADFAATRDQMNGWLRRCRFPMRRSASQRWPLTRKLPVTSAAPQVMPCLWRNAPPGGKTRRSPMCGLKFQRGYRMTTRY